MLSATHKGLIKVIVRTFSVFNRRFLSRNCYFGNATSRLIFLNLPSKIPRGWKYDNSIKYRMRDAAVDILAVMTHRGLFCFRQSTNNGSLCSS